MDCNNCQMEMVVSDECEDSQYSGIIVFDMTCPKCETVRMGITPKFAPTENVGFDENEFLERSRRAVD